MSQTDEYYDLKPEIEDQIRLCFKNQDHKRTFLWMKKSDLLQSVMDRYCHSKSVPIKTFKFIFDGTRLPGEKTPDQFGLEDGDMIEVFEEQIGGGRATLA